MHRTILFVIAAAWVLASGVVAESQTAPKATEQKEQPIDFERAREQLQKRQRGDRVHFYQHVECDAGVLSVQAACRCGSGQVPEDNDR